LDEIRDCLSFLLDFESRINGLVVLVGFSGQNFVIFTLIGRISGLVNFVYFSPFLDELLRGLSPIFGFFFTWFGQK